MRYIFLISLAALTLATISRADDVVYQAPEYKALLDSQKAKKEVKTIDKAESIIPADAETVVAPATPGTPVKITGKHEPVNQNIPQAAPLAKDTYDYTYTDDKPKAVVNASSLGEKPQIKTDCRDEDSTCLTSYTYKDKIVLEAVNKGPATKTMIIDYFLNNMRSTENASGKNIILNAGEKKVIDTLYPEDARYNYGYNYNSHKSYYGIVDAVHDDNYEYDLPYEPGQKWMLIQGVGGSFSHTSEENYYAYDFKMPIGTPVLAAREGVVVKILDTFKEAGTNPEFEKMANFIYVQHSDGTIATYNHISYKGSLVSVGQYVQKGQRIALSGNTGYTNTPHLHFSVFKVVTGGKFKSLAVKMKTSVGVIDKLTPKEVYEKPSMKAVAPAPAQNQATSQPQIPAAAQTTVPAGSSNAPAQPQRKK